eukprot:s1166_g18.t1
MAKPFDLEYDLRPCRKWTVIAIPLAAHRTHRFILDDLVILLAYIDCVVLSFVVSMQGFWNVCCSLELRASCTVTTCKLTVRGMAATATRPSAE